MPFKIVDEQKRYTFQLSGGLPVGECERWGSALYCLCCPLCGMLHEIRGAPLDITGGEYKPHCIVKSTHRTVYADWLAKQPQAADFDRVWLKMRPPAVIPLDTPAKAVKPHKSPPKAKAAQPRLVARTGKAKAA